MFHLHQLELFTPNMSIKHVVFLKFINVSKELSKFSNECSTNICNMLQDMGLPKFKPFISISKCIRFTCSCTVQMNVITKFIYELLTCSVEQSVSWEANRFAASQVISRILWHPEVHYRIHKCPPSVSILTHPNPVHTPTSYFLKINLNITFPSTPGTPQWFLFFRFCHQNPVYDSSPSQQRAPPISLFSILSPAQ
jgi:hypothetical protein